MATTTLGAKAVGSIVKLKENGVLADFYVACQNYESGLNGTELELFRGNDGIVPDLTKSGAMV